MSRPHVEPESTTAVCEEGKCPLSILGFHFSQEHTLFKYHFYEIKGSRHICCSLPTFSSCLHELFQQTMSDSTPQQSGGLFTDISAPQPRTQPVLTIVMHEKQPNLEDSTFTWNRQQSQIAAGPVIIVVMCHSLVHISLIANCPFLTSDLWYFSTLICFNFTLSIFY